jgi:hypothetical protein
MTSMMDFAASRASSELFDRILAAPSGLVVLETNGIHTLIEQFRVIARHTGQAVYLWQPDTGLGNLRDLHVRVPYCQRLGNALRYMRQSMHFGVYFLVGLEVPLSAMDASLLRQLAHAPTEHLRRVVLIDPPAAFAEHLGELAVRLSNNDRQPQRLRLRDGRWLA